MIPFTLLMLVLAQQVYTPADFTQISGTTLKARYDAALSQGRRGADETFWIAYRFPVKPTVRITTWDNNVSITSLTTSDGIEWVPDNANMQKIGVFMLTRKSDGAIERTRLLDLSQNFRIHDRRVYWLGEPDSEESLTLLTGLATSPTQTSPGALIRDMSLHDGPTVGNHLLELARSTTLNPDVRRSAIMYLGQEISRQAGEELDRLTSDPNTAIQRQAVSAISRRPDDESIPALIRIAKEHQNPAVRRFAIQMLGQKRDPRVLDFFEQMLKKN
jgi:HEAT repeats